MKEGVLYLCFSAYAEIGSKAPSEFFSSLSSTSERIASHVYIYIHSTATEDNTYCWIELPPIKAKSI